MNNNIRVPLNNEYFNANFKNIIHQYLTSSITPQKFKELNFFYLFNLPLITKRDDDLKIRINEDIEKFKWEANFIKNIKERKEKIVFQLKQKRYEIVDFSLDLSWRLIIGLGASHPQETSMTLHHIYGIPYIPGSAIKGVTRHWAVLKFAETKSQTTNQDFEEAIEDVSKALENGSDLELELTGDGLKFSDLIKIFGTQSQQGKVIFFDAYPIENLKLKIDIMNPHYPDYYTEGKSPADWQNPIPVKFLTVDKDTRFQFYLASTEQHLLNKAKNLLEEALKNYGIGAKTSLGYGMFNHD